jgi:hypothetical protein
MYWYRLQIKWDNKKNSLQSIKLRNCPTEMVKLGRVSTTFCLEAVTFSAGNAPKR